MGVGDRIQNAAEGALGKAKEVIGDVTDKDNLKREGQADQGKAEAKNLGEDVKDKAGDVKDAFTDGPQ